MNAAQVMHHPAVTVRHDETWRDALRVLLGESVNAVSVVDAEGCIVGVVTQADLATRVRGDERAAMRAMLDGLVAVQPRRMLLRWHQAPHWEQCARVESLMTAPAITVAAETPLSVVASLLLAHDIDQVPVVDADRRPIGAVRGRDLVAAIAAGVPVPAPIPLPTEMDAFAAWAHS